MLLQCYLGIIPNGERRFSTKGDNLSFRNSKHIAVRLTIVRVHCTMDMHCKALIFTLHKYIKNVFINAKNPCSYILI
jgi:hypothetical protein